ncbi:hypothetical protein GCM10010449_13450 [Streptomyces rectiviolaceus]|uniref:Uncharacterized protein n=1 Tax=Streptomyces rectiviolaceus TaxID=332591 RepID=A0ABP6M982_9ACTN
MSTTMCSTSSIDPDRAEAGMSTARMMLADRAATPAVPPAAWRKRRRLNAGMELYL